VSTEVVQNDMNFSVFRLGCDYLTQKGHELCAGVARRGLTDHFTGLRIQGRIQRQSSVPVVLEAVPLGSSW
jgi:hypothetical protein